MSVVPLTEDELRTVNRLLMRMLAISPSMSQDRVDCYAATRVAYQMFSDLPSVRAKVKEMATGQT